MPMALSGSGQRGSTDQDDPTGRLSGEYLRATAQFLRDAGLDPDELVMEVPGARREGAWISSEAGAAPPIPRIGPWPG